MSFLKRIRLFHNTPDSAPKKVVEEIKENAFPLGAMFVTGLKILVVLAILGFLGFKVYTVGRDVANKRQELWFAYTHQDMVKPIRELYEKSHQQADSDLKQVLTGGK